ncbi:MAG: ACP S-malonyltransferase [Balneolaceae bacterium]
MSTACLFPGQGSQFKGMGKTLFDSHSKAAERFLQADEILDYSLSDIMFNGPEEKLTETRYTQPAIFLHSVARFESLDLKPERVAGHSLGEFSAIFASGAIDFENGLQLVSLRGTLMQKAGEKEAGTMAAIIGLEDHKVENICKQASDETQKPVVPANYNCPGQLVISGDVKAVEKAVELAKEQNCRLAKLLPVSGAFHSPLMQSAYEGLKSKLQEITLKKPDFPVYSNYTAKAVTEPKMIRENILQQLLNPVRWTQTLLQMHRDGATRFVEVGPGKVLQGLVKRTLKDVEIEGFQ